MYISEYNLIAETGDMLVLVCFDGFEFVRVCISNLTHLPLDKMAAISQMMFQVHFCDSKVLHLIKISPKFVTKCSITNNPALV